MSLSGTYDTDNIFAKIIRGDMPCVKVYEDGGVIVIMDAFPQSKGHTLVIPKTPSRNLLEVAPKDIGRLFGTVQRLTAAINTALSPDGIVVTQFNGAPAGQTVFHTHVHIIPRYAGEDLKGHAAGAMVDIKDLEPTAALIRAAL